MTATFFFFFLEDALLLRAQYASAMFHSLFSAVSRHFCFQIGVCVCIGWQLHTWNLQTFNIFPVPHSKTQVRAIGSTFGQKSLGEASCFSDLGLGGHCVSHQPFFLA